MFDIFLNDLSHGQGVLLVHVGLPASYTASPHFALLNGNDMSLLGNTDLSKLLHDSNGEVVKIQASPDDYPPSAPHLSSVATTMMSPDDLPPRPPR